MPILVPQYPTPGVPPASSYAPVPNTPAGMGVPVSGTSPINYWAQLGPLTFGCIDQYGIDWFFSDPEGWADGSGVVLSQEQRTNQHGAWVGTTYLAPRMINFKGRVMAPSPIAAWQARNALLGVVAALNTAGVMNTDVVLAVNEPDALKMANVRAADVPVISPVDQAIFTFSIPLIAHDARKYGAPSTVNVLLPTAASGVTFPLGPFGVTFGGTGASGLVQVNNLGNFPATGVIDINGPCANPIIMNTTTGQSMGFSITLGSSDVLEIDLDMGSVILNGTGDRLGTVTPGSVLPNIVPGINTFQYLASSYSALSYAAITSSSVWW